MRTVAVAMQKGGSGKTRSRVTTGFHRLGLFLAVPVLLGAVGTAVSAWFSTEGPYVPDPGATPPLAVSPRDSALNIVRQSKNDQNTIRLKVESGPHRTFAIRFAHLPADKAKTDNQLLNSIVESITKFEKRRGSILLASEQPVEVGDIALVQEDEPERKFGWLSWMHLTRGFDWQRLAFAGVIAGNAIFIYVLARALGWVIDGFVSRPES